MDGMETKFTKGEVTVARAQAERECLALTEEEEGKVAETVARRMVSREWHIASYLTELRRQAS